MVLVSDTSLLGSALFTDLVQREQDAALFLHPSCATVMTAGLQKFPPSGAQACIFNSNAGIS